MELDEIGLQVMFQLLHLTMNLNQLYQEAILDRPSGSVFDFGNGRSFGRD
jgi:hypothetical protein